MEGERMRGREGGREGGSQRFEIAVGFSQIISALCEVSQRGYCGSVGIWDVALEDFRILRSLICILPIVLLES